MYVTAHPKIPVLFFLAVVLVVLTCSFPCNALAADASDERFAVLYDTDSDGTGDALVFQKDGAARSGKGRLIESWGFDQKSKWTWGASDQPWHASRGDITSVSFADPVSPASLAYWFSDMTSLRNIDLAKLDTSQATSMSDLFKSCYLLKTLDLSTFDTSNVTNMGGMFMNCRSLKDVNLTSFDTSKVTSMAYMFCYCFPLAELDLTSFSSESVTYAYRLFSNCSAKKIYVTDKFDLSGLDPASSGGYLFEGSAELIGGTGTPRTNDAIDCTRARIDGGASKPGYFTESCQAGEHVAGNVRWTDSLATCERAGDAVRKTRCAACGRDYIKEHATEPARGHDFDASTGKCSRCQAKISVIPYAPKAKLLVLSPASADGGAPALYSGKPMLWDERAGAWLYAFTGAIDYSKVSVNEGASATTARRPWNSSVCGDASGNGKVNIVDAQIIYDMAKGRTGYKEITPGKWVEADVNDDLFIDASDARAVQVAVLRGWEDISPSPAPPDQSSCAHSFAPIKYYELTSSLNGAYALDYCVEGNRIYAYAAMRLADIKVDLIEADGLAECGADPLGDMLSMISFMFGSTSHSGLNSTYEGDEVEAIHSLYTWMYNDFGEAGLRWMGCEDTYSVTVWGNGYGDYCQFGKDAQSYARLEHYFKLLEENGITARHVMRWLVENPDARWSGYATIPRGDTFGVLVYLSQGKASGMVKDHEFTDSTLVYRDELCDRKCTKCGYEWFARFPL